MKKNKWIQKARKENPAMNFRTNNKGAAIVVVLVVIALVSVLASMVMYMSYANYVMKVNETGTKDNFYSAETVLDQINSGLQTHVSSAVGVAYDVASQTTTSENATLRENSFKNSYINNLITSLKNGSMMDQYNIGTISPAGDATGFYAFLDNHLLNMAKNYDSATDGPLVADTGYVRIYSTNQLMEQTLEGLVLRNVIIEFQDEQGYYSEIHTDIRLSYPDISMATQQSFPDVDTYAIIADGGLEGSNAGNISLTGNVYAGNRDYTGTGSGKYGIHLSGSTTMNLEGSSGAYCYAITKGGIDIDSSKLNVTRGNVWTDDISISGGGLNLSGEQSVIYNADDLTISGTGTKVQMEGSYVGFGDGIYNYSVPQAHTMDVSSLSSAIVVNAKNATVDMKNMTGLYLAGTAYLNPYTTSNYALNYAVSKFNTTEVEEKILIGNSLAVKIDQLAYLIPRGCVGVLDGETIINQNPMTQSEYDLWRAYNTAGKAGYTPVDFSKFYDAYGFYIAAEPHNYNYQVVAKQTSSGSLYYLYLTFTNDADSSAYYKTYVDAVADKMNTYATKYNNKIYLPNTTGNINTSGNLVSCQLNGAGDMTYALYEANMGGTNNINSINKNYALTYETWCSLLSSNKDLTGDRTKSVYENTIDESQFSHYSLGTYTGENGVKARVIDGDFTVDGSTDSNLKLIIATGNVNVSASYDGLIIAGGHVDITAGCNITSNETSVQKALLAEVDADHSVASAFFVNGSIYSAASNSASSSVSYTNVKDLIVYENWTKE